LSKRRKSMTGCFAVLEDTEIAGVLKVLPRIVSGDTNRAESSRLNSKAIRRVNNRAGDARLAASMSRGANHYKLRRWPGAMERPRAHHWADYVVPSLNDHNRNVANLVNIFQQIIVGLEKCIIDEVMRFDARK